LALILALPGPTPLTCAAKVIRELKRMSLTPRMAVLVGRAKLCLGNWWPLHVDDLHAAAAATLPCGRRIGHLESCTPVPLPDPGVACR
jgi:hypothetical protein